MIGRVCQPELAPLWRLDLAPFSDQPGLNEPRRLSKSTLSIASPIFVVAVGDAGETVGVSAGRVAAVSNVGVESTATSGVRECQPALV